MCEAIIWCETCTYRVPSRYHWEPICSAPGVRPARHIIQRRCGIRIQERVQETERAHARTNTAVVEKRDDTGECRRARARTLNGLGLSGDLNQEIHALCGHVRVRTPGRVEQSLIRIPDVLDVLRYSCGLVVGLSEQVRKSACREARSDFGAALGGPD